MISLIHGSNGLASFRALEQIKNKFDELSITKLAGSGLDLNDLKEAVETPSFSGPRLVIVEDLNQNRSPSLLKELATYLKKVPPDAELVIYERKLLAPDSGLLSLPVKIQAFPQASGVNVFAWGDSVGGRQPGPAIKGWQKLIESGEDEEYLFLMIVRQFRLLVLAKSGHPPKGPDFVREKIAAQSRLWSEAELRSVYRKLLEIDRRHKTGAASLEVGMTELLSLIGKVKVS